MKRYEYVEQKAREFWEVNFQKNDVITKYDRIRSG